MLIPVFLGAIIARLRTHLAWRAAERAGDPAAAQLESMALSADAELASVRGAGDLPIDELLGRLQLHRFQVELVLCAAAPHLDPSLRGELELLSPRRQRHVDAALVLELFPSPRNAGAVMSGLVHAHDALVEAGLVEYVARRDGHVASLLEHEVVPTPRLLAILRGRLARDPALAEVTRLHPGDEREVAGILVEAEWLELRASFAGMGRGARLWLHGPPRSGKTTVAGALAVAAGHRHVLTAEAPLLPTEPAALVAFLRRLHRESEIVDALLALRHVDALPAQTQRVLASALAELGCAVVLIGSGDEIASLDELVTLRFEVKRPDATLRTDAWREELARVDATLDEDGLLELGVGFPLARPQIATAVALASSIAAGSIVTVDQCERAARTQVHSQLARFARRIVPRARLEDLVLPDDVCALIDEIIAAVRAQPSMERAWRDAAGMPLNRGIGALFNGPPGTGKTMAATAIARELRTPLYRVDVSSVVNRYIGETEKNLVRVFEEAASDRAMLLFDEADSLFARRVDVKDSNDRYSNMQVNLLLNLIEDYPGTVVLTTNLKSTIDSAFLRRIAFKVTFDLPDDDERLALWSLHLPAARIDTGADLESLARDYKTSGGEIKNAVFRAALRARDGMITQPMLDDAIRSELQSAGRVVR